MSFLFHMRSLLVQRFIYLLVHHPQQAVKMKLHHQLHYCRHYSKGTIHLPKHSRLFSHHTVSNHMPCLLHPQFLLS